MLPAGPLLERELTVLLFWTRLTLLKPFSILRYWLRSPLHRLSDSVVKSSIFNLSSYLRFFSFGTSLVALLCTTSTVLASFFLYGDQTDTAYSEWGLTYDEFNFLNIDTYQNELKYCLTIYELQQKRPSI